MRVALINPPIEDAYGEMDLSDVKSTSPPLGLLSIASVLRNRGVQVEVFDGRFPNWVADIYAFTAMSINVKTAIKWSECLRQWKYKTVIGGNHATALPESVKEHFDAVWTGEGETWAGFPEHYNLDDLPYPAFDLVPLSRYKLSSFGTHKRRSIGLVTSRGCYGKCNFCSRCVFGNKIKKHSAEYVYGLMEKLYAEYGIDDYLFYDDIFVADDKRLEKFCSLVGGVFTWSCCARVDSVDFEKLKMMKKAGCHLIEYGIESGSQRILDDMGKGITVEKAEEAVKLTKKAGIKTKGNFILGYPSETRETLRETMDFARRICLDYAQHTFFTPLPGSDDWGKYGDSDYTRCNTFIPKQYGDVSIEELSEASRKFYRAFYFRPKTLLEITNPRRLWDGIKAFRKVAFRKSSKSVS